MNEAFPQAAGQVKQLPFTGDGAFKVFPVLPSPPMVARLMVIKDYGRYGKGGQG